MKLPMRDVVATALVAVAVVVYVVWSAVTADPSTTSVRLVAGVVLAAGFVASATAVVPSFEALMHGSKAYLGGASLVGLIALVTGVVALFGADEAMLAVLVLATVVLWLMATTRHMVAAGHGGRWVHSRRIA